MPIDRPPDRTWEYGSGPDQVADVYVPDAAASPLSTVALIHGGFWRPTYDRVHLRPLAIALADRGHTVFSLEYRRVPGDPDATTSDVRSAISLLPDDVQLIGHSAGGHLVLWLAAEPDLSVTVVALAPVADLVLADDLDLGAGAVRAFLGTSPGSRADLDPVRRSAPRRAVSVIHGEQDDTVPIDIGASYAAVMAPHARLVAIPECGHFEPIDPTSHVWPLLLGELDRLAGLRGIE